jgi:hypothetical protein
MQRILSYRHALGMQVIKEWRITFLMLVFASRQLVNTVLYARTILYNCVSYSRTNMEWVTLSQFEVVSGISAPRDGPTPGRLEVGDTAD